MTPAQLSRTVLLTLPGVLSDAGLDPGLPLPPRVVIESPPRRGAGDYATGVVLQLARTPGLEPRALAHALGERLERQAGIGRAEVSGAGFVNLTLEASGRADLVRALSGAEPDAAPAPVTAQPGVTDVPARDAACWAAVTGDDVPALLVRTHASSPLFRVQYAHARTRALLRNGADLGLRPEPGAGGHPYGHRAERALLALLADHARVAAAGAAGRHARHLTAVADAHADVCDLCPSLPRGDEKPRAAHRARLALAEATGAVLAGGLSQLGITAPVHL